MSPKEIVDRVSDGLPTDWVVLTGGEPLRQNILPLLLALEERDRRVQIETNGTLWLPGITYTNPVVVCSPKTDHVDGRLDVHSWKYVLRSGYVDDRDGLPLGLARPFPVGSSVFVQPMDEGSDQKNRENVVVAVNACMKFGYRLSLQLHKIVGME